MVHQTHEPIKNLTLSSITDCEEHCDRHKSCKSVTYCEGGQDKNKCFLSSQPVQGSSPQENTDGDCRTSYDPCASGEKLFKMSG